MMHNRLILLCVLLFAAPAKPQPPSIEVQIPSSKDGSRQPALFYVPAGGASTKKGTRVPLLVYLHSWSTDYKSAGGWDEALEESRRRGWVAIVPNFRGKNDHPDA